MCIYIHTSCSRLICCISVSALSTNWSKTLSKSQSPSPQRQPSLAAAVATLLQHGNHSPKDPQGLCKDKFQLHMYIKVAVESEKGGVHLFKVLEIDSVSDGVGASISKNIKKLRNPLGHTR